MKLNKLKEKLREEEIDAFVTKKNARYLSETAASSFVIATPRKSVLLCGRLDYDRAKDESVTDEVRAYSKTKVPFRKGEQVIVGSSGEAIGGILGELSADRIGHDGLDNGFLDELREKHEAEYQKEKDIVWNLRSIKTSEELKRIKKACELGEIGLQRAEEVIEAGKTEIEVAAEIEYEMRKAGSKGTPFKTIVAAGENSRFPHTEPGEKEIREGEPVVVDLGASWNGYVSDMTRTFLVSPTEKQKNLLQTAKRAQEAGLEKVTAGIDAAEVDEAAREVFREENYEEFYLHSIGHGVGLDVHEPPTLSQSSDDELEENMVVTIEPGIYLEGLGGYRFEDMVVVKEDGYERLTSY